MQVVPGPAGYLSIVFLCKWFRDLLDINILFSYAGVSRACWISRYCFLMQVVPGPAGYQYIVFLCRWFQGLLDIYLLFSYAGGSRVCWISIYFFLMQGGSRIWKISRNIHLCYVKVIPGSYGSLLL